MKLSGAAQERFVKTPSWEARAALLYGPNRSRIADAAAAIVAQLLGPKPGPYAITRLADDEIRKDRARLNDELAAQGLFAERADRIVRLRIEGDSAADAILDALAALQSGGPAGAFLLVEAGELTPRSKIRKAFEDAPQAAALPFYEDTQTDIAAFAEALLAQAKLDLAPDAKEEALAAMPPDRAAARAEIEKLILFAHNLDRPISEQDVAALAIARDDEDFDDAAGAALSGDIERTHARLRGLEQSQGVSALKAMTRRLLRLSEIRAAMAAGASAQDAIAALKPPVFWKEKDALAAQSRAWIEPRLNVALNWAWGAEMASKRAGAPQHLIATELFTRIARAAKAGRR